MVSRRENNFLKDHTPKWSFPLITETAYNVVIFPDELRHPKLLLHFFLKMASKECLAEMHVLAGGEMQSLERGMVADMPPPNKRISTSRRDILGLSGYVLLQKTWLHSASHLVKKCMVFLYCVHVPENGDSDEPGATPNKKSVGHKPPSGETELALQKFALLGLGRTLPPIG